MDIKNTKLCCLAVMGAAAARRAKAAAKRGVLQATIFPPSANRRRWTGRNAEAGQRTSDKDGGARLLQKKGERTAGGVNWRQIEAGTLDDANQVAARRATAKKAARLKARVCSPLRGYASAHLSRPAPVRSSKQAPGGRRSFTTVHRAGKRTRWRVFKQARLHMAAAKLAEELEGKIVDHFVAAWGIKRFSIVYYERTRRTRGTSPAVDRALKKRNLGAV